MGKIRKLELETAANKIAATPVSPAGPLEKPLGKKHASASKEPLISTRKPSGNPEGKRARSAGGKGKKHRKSGPGPLRRQVAALPFRRTVTGEVEILIITSRATRRFVIPKGWPMKKRRKNEAAAVEAFEEAGVNGAMGRKPVGRYSYWKRLKETFSLVRVVVYALEVKEQASDWPERDQRLLSWLPPTDAAILVDEPGLAKIIRTFK